MFAAPQRVTDLIIASSRLTSAHDTNSVTVNVSWTGPSTRNGSYYYNLTYSCEQVADYPEHRRRIQSVKSITINGSELQASVQITTLPYANCTFSVTAYGIRSGRPGPETVVKERTINRGSLKKKKKKK